MRGAELIAGPAAAPPTHPDDELPVVARLVVEIRSDGSRTVARGALEDRATGQEVALEARGGTPAELAVALTRQLLAMPLLAGPAALRALVPERLRRTVGRLPLLGRLASGRHPAPDEVRPLPPV